MAPAFQPAKVTTYLRQEPSPLEDANSLERLARGVFALVGPEPESTTWVLQPHGVIRLYLMDCISRVWDQRMAAQFVMCHIAQLCATALCTDQAQLHTPTLSEAAASVKDAWHRDKRQNQPFANMAALRDLLANSADGVFLVLSPDSHGPTKPGLELLHTHLTLDLEALQQQAGVSTPVDLPFELLPSPSPSLVSPDQPPAGLVPPPSPPPSHEGKQFFDSTTSQHVPPNDQLPGHSNTQGMSEGGLTGQQVPPEVTLITPLSTSTEATLPLALAACCALGGEDCTWSDVLRLALGLCCLSNAALIPSDTSIQSHVPLSPVGSQGVPCSPMQSHATPCASDAPASGGIPSEGLSAGGVSALEPDPDGQSSELGLSGDLGRPLCLPYAQAGDIKAAVEDAAAKEGLVLRLTVQATRKLSVGQLLAGDPHFMVLQNATGPCLVQLLGSEVSEAALEAAQSLLSGCPSLQLAWPPALPMALPTAGLPAAAGELLVRVQQALKGRAGSHMPEVLQVLEAVLLEGLPELPPGLWETERQVWEQQAQHQVNHSQRSAVNNRASSQQRLDQGMGKGDVWGAGASGVQGTQQQAIAASQQPAASWTAGGRGPSRGDRPSGDLARDGRSGARPSGDQLRAAADPGTTWQDRTQPGGIGRTHTHPAATLGAAVAGRGSNRNEGGYVAGRPRAPPPPQCLSAPVQSQPWASGAPSQSRISGTPLSHPSATTPQQHWAPQSWASNPPPPGMTAQSLGVGHAHGPSASGPPPHDHVLLSSTHVQPFPVPAPVVASPAKVERPRRLVLPPQTPPQALQQAELQANHSCSQAQAAPLNTASSTAFPGPRPEPAPVAVMAAARSVGGNATGGARPVRVVLPTGGAHVLPPSPHLANTEVAAPSAEAQPGQSGTTASPLLAGPVVPSAWAATTGPGSTQLVPPKQVTAATESDETMQMLLDLCM